jgi:hypothetical protein
MSQKGLPLNVNERSAEAERVVLLLGSIDSEGIRSTLKATGQRYVIKRLESSPHNWATIVSLFDGLDIRCCAVKLTGNVYEYFLLDEYQQMAEVLLRQIARLPHAIFVHQELFSGNLEEADDEEADDGYFEYVRSSLHQPNEITRNAVNQLLVDYGLNVLPYKTNAELTLLASTFITESQEGLLFRIYVPSGRLWANETDRLIQLFRDYLTRIAKTSVRLDQQRTAHGIVYEFFDAEETRAGPVSEESLALQFQEFSRFLDLAVSDPERAESILLAKKIDPREVVPILTRYAKEARRLQVDLKHEREQKVLAIQQRLESELVDCLPPSADWDTVSKLVNTAVPQLDGIKSITSYDESPRQLAGEIGSPITVNFQPQIIQAINAVVAQEIDGDIHLTDIDKQLLELISQHAAEDATELKSAVHELADTSAPKSHRLMAKQRLKAFLFKLGSVATDVGSGLFLSYLEKRYGLK